MVLSAQSSIRQRVHPWLLRWWKRRLLWIMSRERLWRVLWLYDEGRLLHTLHWMLGVWQVCHLVHWFCGFLEMSPWMPISHRQQKWHHLCRILPLWRWQNPPKVRMRRKPMPMPSFPKRGIHSRRQLLHSPRRFSTWARSRRKRNWYTRRRLPSNDYLICQHKTCWSPTSASWGYWQRWLSKTRGRYQVG